MCLGTVIELGSEVDHLKLDNRAFAHLPLRETHTVIANKLQITPEDVSPQALMYWDPADFAVVSVRLS